MGSTPALPGTAQGGRGESTRRSQGCPVTIGSGLDAASAYREKTSAMSKVLCPNCGGSHPRRLERKGFLQERVYPLFGYYPWVCGACKSTFLMRKRYRRKSKEKDHAE